jgi:hypothetical protein
MRREKMHKPNFKGAETGDLTSAIGKYQEEKSIALWPQRTAYFALLGAEKKAGRPLF